MRFVRLLRVVHIYKKANTKFNQLDDNNEFKRIVLRHRAYQRKLKLQAIEDSKRLGALSSANDSSLRFDNSKMSVSPPSKSKSLDASKTLSDNQDVSYVSSNTVQSQVSQISDNTLKQLVPQESRLSKKLSE
jgi:hypothetical protein